MKTLELKAEARETTGSKDAAALRRQGMIPCVLYGGDKPVHFAATEAELKKIIYSPAVYFAELNIGAEKFKAVMQEIQFNAVTDKPEHIDFLQVLDGKNIKLQLPVRVTGNSAGVRSGGKLVVNVRKLTVEALPDQMPDDIELDITNLNIGDKLRVADLSVAGVKFHDPANLAVAAVQMTRSAISAQAAAEQDKKK
ncbi:MAG: 50S ribosomal protein L25 [Candidatus Competibacteraceae bacterium]|nr:50S ribosomal protein L25 [Candidatus Competibacteraceae bacterium]